MRPPIYKFLLLLLVVLSPAASAQRTDFTQCCDKALKHQSLGSGYTCGASYSGSKEPAKSVSTTLKWCMDECNGFQLSRITHLGEWAGPLVGFLLPGLVFSMSIPRGWELSVPGFLFESELPNCGSTPQTLFYLFIALLITAIETIRWVTVVFVCAGPMLVGGLYEMFLDNRLLQKLVGLQEFEKSAAVEMKKRRILITLLLGNLSIKNGAPTKDAKIFVLNASVTEAKARLHSLLESQSSFGAVVGSPVIFYAGAFLYALLDALKNLGDNDTSHAIALGLWYSIIVIVATVSGCLLGCNNPAALEGIISDKPPPVNRKASSSAVFLSRYNPVSLWDRGASAHDWAGDQQCKEVVTIADWIGYIGFFTIILTSVPCWLAFTVSFYTPEIGLGCRSFMFLLYWVSQMTLITAFILKQADVNANVWIRTLATIFGSLALVLAFVTAIGGTIMQLTGVFRNCICKAGIRSFTNRNGNFNIQLATDTQVDRDWAKKVWMPTGGAGLALVGTLCLYAWWYQRNIRQNCSHFIHGLEEFPAEGNFFRLRASVADSPLPYRQYVQAPANTPHPDLNLESHISAAQLRLTQKINSEGSLRDHLVTDHTSFLPSGRQQQYIHVQKRAALETLELTWESYPDQDPAGEFVWQGNRLAWATKTGLVLDGFLAGLTAGDAKKIFINARGYGTNPSNTGSEIPTWLFPSWNRTQPRTEPPISFA